MEPLASEPFSSFLNLVFEKHNAKVEHRKGKKYSMRGGSGDFLFVVIQL
jgi:hypothetical protein